MDRWTIEGRIMEDRELGDFELLWAVTSGPKPPSDGYEVEVVRAPSTPVQRALTRIARKRTELDDIQLRNHLPVLALQDPREVTAQMALQAEMAADFAQRGLPYGVLLEAVAAQAAAALMALDRVEELDITSGNEAA